MRGRGSHPVQSLYIYLAYHEAYDSERQTKLGHAHLPIIGRGGGGGVWVWVSAASRTNRQQNAESIETCYCVNGSVIKIVVKRAATFGTPEKNFFALKTRRRRIRIRLRIGRGRRRKDVTLESITFCLAIEHDF